MNRLPTASSSFTPKNYAGMSSDITGKIVQMVKHRQACDMEDLLEACSSYTWNQVFLEVDRLSRNGELCVCFPSGPESTPSRFRPRNTTHSFSPSAALSAVLDWHAHNA